MIAMAMYTVIEKESQIIDAELKIVEQWLEIIEEKHTTDTAGTSTDYYGRTTTETGTTNYNESDLNFISRILESSDQKIMSLQTGLTVLEQKLQTAGDDAALANIDLQNMLQKQQQTLQTMSNVSKMLHDTAMSVIQKIG
jgi:succinate dehydrogenase flavin-adding protein (antitoxin of CptAB toxin-antitoxin module)